VGVRALALLVPLAGLCVGACSANGSEPEPDGDHLSATGLYADTATGKLADGVQAFRPQYELWSDGATKRRWLWLPPGARIDTSDMDGWRFPVGTKVWKEFVRDGVRVETRMLRKDGPRRTDWKMVAYVWNREQTEALAAPDGQPDALGTPHDVPSSKMCKECHGGVADAVIGVSAIQLDHDLGDLNLSKLATDNLLTMAPATSYPVPGNDLERATLGYLHANCGHCHNDRAAGPAGVLFRLDLTVGGLGSVQQTPAYRTAIGTSTRVKMPLAGTTATKVVVPGDPDASLLYIRMLRRGPSTGQMPTVASELVDRAGSDTVAAWIRALAP
jgi:hypothetical protein